jgi:hypothetical protein
MRSAAMQVRRDVLRPIVENSWQHVETNLHTGCALFTVQTTSLAELEIHKTILPQATYGLAPIRAQHTTAHHST